MSQTEQDAEISLVDIWAIINRYKRMILAAPIICGIAAYVLVAFVIPPQWEASAILQVGQVGQVGQVQAEKVEPIANVIVRVQHPSFAAGVLHQTTLKPGEWSAAKSIYESSLKAAKIKDADLIEFSLRGYSADMASTLAASTVSYLQEIHTGIVTVGVARIKTQIQIADEEIQSLKSEMNTLDKQLQGKREWNSYNATLGATVLQDKINRLREVTQRKLLLKELLSPSVTFTTRPFGDITVSAGPVSPNKPRFVGIAILIGLLGSLFIAFVHNALNKTGNTVRHRSNTGGNYCRAPLAGNSEGNTE